MENNNKTLCVFVCSPDKDAVDAFIELTARREPYANYGLHAPLGMRNPCIQQDDSSLWRTRFELVSTPCGYDPDGYIDFLRSQHQRIYPQFRPDVCVCLWGRDKHKPVQQIKMTARSCAPV